MEGGSSAATGLTNTDVRILAVDPRIDNTSSGAAESSLVNITGDLTSSLGNRVTANPGLTVNPEADLSVTKTDGVTSAIPGQSLTYTIVASINGPSADPSVTITDTFPADLTRAFTTAGTGALTNTATVANSVPNSNPALTAATKSVTAPNTATDNETLLTPQVHLTLSKGDGVPAVIPGANLT